LSRSSVLASAVRRICDDGVCKRITSAP
jgi:hypothetical protein